MNDFDAIVIGAGNAGLTAAATLQRAGARTLLVERHNVPGGCATSFRRGRFEFEVALHQLSGIGRPGQKFSLRGLLESLDVADKLDFVQEGDLYRMVVPGVMDVTLPADWAGAVEAIETAYPGSRARVERFFDLIRRVSVSQVSARMGLPADRVDPVLFRHGLRTVKDVLDEHFDDDRIKALLGVYWCYLGQPPSVLTFQDYALTLFIYFEYKPWHLGGGSQSLSSALLDSFKAAGGQVRFNTAVEGILTQQGAVSGVRLEGGEEITAADVVSNASTPTTYGMLDPAIVPPAIWTDLGTRRIGVSAFVMHMGLAATPAELGFTSGTTFISTDLNDDRTFAAMHTLNPARTICVTSYGVAPAGFAPAGASHISLATLQYADAWDKVAPKDYARTKFAYAQTMLDLLETMAPGVRDAIEEVDVATPLTMTRFLGHPGGAIYGFDQDATEGWLFRDSERNTHVPGLHLAGSWSSSGGFQPTLQAGARVAHQLLHTTSPRLRRRVRAWAGVTWRRRRGGLWRART